MSLPNANFWIRADITLFSIAISESPFTRTLSFTNKPVISTSTSTIYYPLITNLSDFGARMGTFIPAESSATLSLNNAWGAFGYNRCITDLLQRFTMINQDVKIYFALDTPDDLEPESWTQIFQGKVRAVDYNAADASQSLSIAISADTLPERQIVPEFGKHDFGQTAPIDGLPETADTQGERFTVPFIFGDQQVKPIKAVPAINVSVPPAAPGVAYSIVINTLEKYIYGANLKQKFVNHGVRKYYAKDHRGRYVYVRGHASPTTAQFVIESGGTPSGGPLVWSAQTEMISRFAVPAAAAGLEYNIESGSGNNWILTALKIRMQTQTGGTLNGVEDKYICKIYAFDHVGLPTIEMARSEVLVSDTPAWDLVSTATYDVIFALNKPVVMDEAFNFAFGISQTKDSTAASWSMKLPTYLNSGHVPWLIDQSDASLNKNPYLLTAVGGTAPYFQAFGFAFNDVPSPSTNLSQDGYGLSYFTVQYAKLGGSYSSLAAEVTTESPFVIDFIVWAGGIKDDSSGSITGVANQAIQNPKHVAHLFTWEYDGSNWVDPGKFNASAYSYSHSEAFTRSTNPYARQIQGRLNNKITVASLFERLCQNSGARIAVRSDGKLGIWGWGAVATAAAKIDQNDLRVIDISYKGKETCINEASVVYEPFLYNSNLSRLIDSQNTKDYAFAAYWNRNSAGKASEYTRLRPSGFSANNFSTPSTNQDTVEAFGVSSLRLNEFDLLGDSSSVEGILSFYFAFYGLPSVFVSVEVPLERYYTLELLDVIEIQHPMLPSFYGSSSYNQNSYNDSGGALDWKKGVYNPRAETYRAIVESRTFALGRGQAPKLKMNLRLLLNSPKDPT